ncbi:hypothetical protein ACWCQZ_36970 [Streptomyces sp. NPDC002285]|uniref:hypothetical protein n=1 Tax=Streptomyces sp. NPDC056468 TaxID=3345830 RepID=UPI003677A87A
MANTQSISYERIAEVLTELGMITKEQAQRALDQAAAYATEPMARRREIADALESIGVAVSIHADDVDFADEHYEWLLDEAAALTGGSVTVSNYRFDKANPDDEDCGLGTVHFECNGRPLSFGIEQESNDYLDMGAAQQAIESLTAHDDPREFRCVELEGSDPGDDYMVLATAEQRDGLLRHLGIVFEAPLR